MLLAHKEAHRELRGLVAGDRIVRWSSPGTELAETRRAEGRSAAFVLPDVWDKILSREGQHIDGRYGWS